MGQGWRSLSDPRAGFVSCRAYALPQFNGQYSSPGLLLASGENRIAAPRLLPMLRQFCGWLEGAVDVLRQQFSAGLGEKYFRWLRCSVWQIA